MDVGDMVKMLLEYCPHDRFITENDFNNFVSEVIEVWRVQNV